MCGPEILAFTSPRVLTPLWDAALAAVAASRFWRFEKRMSNQLLSAYEGPERRHIARSAANVPVNLREAARRKLPALLVSLSPLGCSVTGVSVNPRQDQVWLRLPGLESQAARCVWRKPGAAGFAFEHPLHPAVARRFYCQAAPEVPPRAANDQPPVRRPGESYADKMQAVRRRMAEVVDQRLEERFGAPARATLGFRLCGAAARLLDVSASGIQVAGEIAAPVGATVKVAFAGHPEMAGRIVWVRAGATGVRLPENALELFEAA